MANKNKISSMTSSATDIIAWVKTRLQTYTGWSVETYPGTSYSKILSHLSTMPLPAAVISYKGSSASDSYPRRTLNFSIVIAAEDVGDFQTAALNAQTLIDKALELLDYEESNGILFKFKNDVPIEYKTDTIAIYNLSFTAEDF